jgi:hypothetical protein
VKLNEGAIATAFQPRHFDEELAKCQRYYDKSYNLGTAPGSSANLIGVKYILVQGLNSGTHVGRVSCDYKVSMRTAPTITFYAPSSGNSGKITMQSGEIDGSTIGIGDVSFVVTGTETSAQTSMFMHFHWTAEAEL